MTRRFRTDVAIVGCGVSGLYAAERLSRARPNQSISAFEASDVFGGRARSDRVIGGDIVLEHGAMFISDAHALSVGLADRLGVPRRLVEWRTTGRYLRGRFVAEQDFTAPDALPYRLEEGERGKNFQELLVHAIEQAVPGLPAPAPIAPDGPRWDMGATAEYLRKVRVRRRRLRDWGLSNLLDGALSSELHKLLAAACGLASSWGHANAEEALFTLVWEMRQDQQFYMFPEGAQQLALALKKASEERVAFHPRWTLKRVAALAEGCRLQFDCPDGAGIVEAETVILALPKDALARIAFDEGAVFPQFHRDLDAVSAIPACKLFLAFERAWWSAQAPNRDVCETVAAHTDLPLQQCYCSPQSGAVAVMMAVFADDPNAAFWSHLAGGAYRDERPRPWLVHDDPATRPSRAMIEAARRQLQCLHPALPVPEPIGGVFVDWSKRGGAWHAWKPYVSGAQVRGRIQKPNSQLPLFICGEAFARPQGWIEGALINTEVMLQKHFNLQGPDWVRTNYLNIEGHPSCKANSATSSSP